MTWSVCFSETRSHHPFYYLISEHSPVSVVGLDANNSDNFHDGNPYQGEQCGGVIIDEKNILTAGHCQTNKKPLIKFHSIIVFAGVLLNKKALSLRKSFYEVCGWTIHPEYFKKEREGKTKPFLYAPDIAILHLCEPLIFRKGKFDIFVL